MRARHKTRSAAFSLIELVVVIVIIGIIAAMAIPRLSRGTAGAADSALAGDLAIIRNAINLYWGEHNSTYPTQADFENQLIQYSSLAGAPQANKDAAHPYGPYLMAIPPCPVGDQTDPTAVAFDSSHSPPDVTADTGGWIYNPTTGEFLANTNVPDSNGKTYNTY
jgi:prepilin-type N-terminal cleavage/methylation domain-containing protein